MCIYISIYINIINPFVCLIATLSAAVWATGPLSFTSVQNYKGVAGAALESFMEETVEGPHIA